MPIKVFSSADALRKSRYPYHIGAGIPEDGFCVKHEVECIKENYDGLPVNSNYEVCSIEDAETHGEVFASYKLKELPGCCGVVVSYNAFVDPIADGKGLGEHFHKERIQLAKEMNYSCMVCTVTAQNLIQINLLKKNDWVKVHEFKNKRTGNIVEMWVKNV